MADGWEFNAGGGGESAGTQDVGGFQYQQMLPYPPASILIKSHTVFTTTSEATIIAAGGATVHRDLIWLYIANLDTVAVTVTIRDDTGGTAVLTVVVQPKTSLQVNIPPRLFATNDNDNWTAKLNSNADVNITAIAVKRSTIE